ncbi:TonB-dependent receptor [Aquimarina sp. 2201CG1-2-11]|uniref:TonB-dependent receptor plug domain-containing protein n=1 Tax=Aquimarina discodermiae TaxID=3231043 RepID=UPI0034621E7F
MIKKRFLGVAFLMLGSSVVFGQETQIEENVNELEEVVISDSKFKLKREHSGKVITKVTEKELQRSQGQSVANVLSRVAGMVINGNTSGAGKDLGYFIRGGRNRQVVIRVDGVTISDPAIISGEFDLRLLSVNQVKEIEILKGASSTLYGSGAGTAVVNILTKKASKEKVTANFQSSIGTNQTNDDQDYDINEFVNLASVNGTLGKLTYLTSFSNRFTDGISSAKKLPEDTSVGSFTSDAYSQYNVNAKLGYKWSDRLNIGFLGNLDAYKNDIDDGAGVDGQNISDSEQVRVGANLTYTYPKGSIGVVTSYALLERTFETAFPSKSESRFYTYDVYNKYKFNNRLYTVIGINGSNSDYNGFNASGRGEELIQTINDREADFDIVDPYANLVYVSSFGLNVNAGARLNVHSSYGTHVVYTINPSYTYKIGENYLKGIASYSTAYITPSLFQLYAADFGNQDLKPEENATIEGGVEFSWAKKIRVSAVYFNRKEKNFVDFVDTGDFIFKYQNIENEFTTDGVEFEVSSTLFDDKLSLSGNLTYTNVDDEVSSIRIPEYIVNTNIGYQLNKKTYTSIRYQFNDSRDDSFFNNITFASEPRSLDSYHLLDFYVSHQLLKNLNIYGSVDNIINEEYQEVFGFSTRGRNVRVGFNLKF